MWPRPSRISNHPQVPNRFFEDQDTLYKPHESVVSFVEPEREELHSEPEEDKSAPAAVSEKTPSEVSAGVTSDTASAAFYQWMASLLPLRQVYPEMIF